MATEQAAYRILAIQTLLARHLPIQERRNLMDEQRALWDNYARGLGFEQLVQITIH